MTTIVVVDKERFSVIKHGPYIMQYLKKLPNVQRNVFNYSKELELYLQYVNIRFFIDTLDNC